MAASGWEIAAQDIDPRPSQTELVNAAKLGSGSFGLVYKGEWHYAPVAVKKLLASVQLSEEAKEELATEMKALVAVQHPNVVRVFGACTQGADAAIVMEYIER